MQVRLFKIIKKAPKRLTAVFTAFAILATATFASAAINVLPDNSTTAENNATPKYYNALEHFSSTDNYEGSGNIFGYQFKTDNTYDEWQYLDHCRNSDYWYNPDRLKREHFPSLADEQWNTLRGDNNHYLAVWMLAITSKGYMHLRNYQNCMANLPTVPAVAYLFTAKHDGYVNIPAGNITLFTTKIAEKGYKALLRITKNGENIYPQSGYMELDDNTKATYPDLDFAVAEGDEIRFELTANMNPVLNEDDSIWVKWNPYISIRGEQDLYTETDDIYNGLTGYMNDYFANQTSGNMTVTGALELAIENSKRSKYGVYTALDSIYSAGVIPTNDSSVWKYAVYDKIPAGFSMPKAEYSLSAVTDQKSVTVSWNDASTSSLDALKVVCDGKAYTYLAQNSQSSITLPFSAENGIKLQLNGKNGPSEIVSVTTDSVNIIADTDTDDSLTYLSTATKEGSGISTAYKISGNALSNYKIHYSTNSVTGKDAAEKYRRSIVFNSVDGEEMMFGFTAVMDGSYEITAPIEVYSDCEVEYSILKQDLSDNFTVVDGIRKYIENKNGFAANTDLLAGETVWLNACATKDTEISIGIPRVTYKPSVTDTNGISAYKYRAVDYVESNAFTKLAYNSASLTNKEGTVWEFGTFENPIKEVDGVINYDSLGYTTLAVGDDASAITELFKPYEVIRGGIWYNPLTMVVNSEGVIGATHANGVPGTLHTLLGTSYQERDRKGLPYLSKGFMVAVGVGKGKDNADHNMGVYMRFTAPTSGNVTLNLSDFTEARTATRVTLLKGNEVVKTYASVIPMGEVVDLGYMNKGEKAYICYGIATTGKPYNYGGFPVATVSGENVTFSFGSNLALSAESTEFLATKNTQFTLPAFSDTIGKAVIGWNDKNGSYYSVGRKYTAKSDNTFKPVRRNFGDITGDGKINAVDVSIIRRNLIKGKADMPSISDLTSDGSFNLKDLVRMKKWIAGYTVPFCQE